MLDYTPPTQEVMHLQDRHIFIMAEMRNAEHSQIYEYNEITSTI